MPDFLSPRKSTLEALKEVYMEHSGTTHSNLADMRILAVYQCPKGYMILIFLFKRYQLIFLDSYRITKETATLSTAYTDQGVKGVAKNIADIIGATLIEEPEEEQHV